MVCNSDSILKSSQGKALKARLRCPVKVFVREFLVESQNEQVIEIQIAGSVQLSASPS